MALVETVLEIPKSGVEVPMSGTRPKLLTETEVARFLSVSVAALRRWRLEGRGPRFLKLGSAVRYRQEDVKAWLDSRPMGGEVVGGPNGEERKAA